MDSTLEFFIDRSLGRVVVPAALRAAGFVVHTMADVYGERIGQGLKDETWLRDVGQHGWVVLMKDDATRRRPAERDALIDGGVRAFCLTMRSFVARNRHAAWSRTVTGSCGRPSVPARTSTASTKITSTGCGRGESRRGDPHVRTRSECSQPPTGHLPGAVKVS
jgi:hypothetical protein